MSLSPSPPATPPCPAPDRRGSFWKSWGFALGVCFAAYLLLFGLIPYSQGYFGQRLALFRIVYAFWTGYEDWQYCMVVPLFSAGIVWMQRKQLLEIPLKGSNWGLPVIVFALALYWLGYVVDHHYIGFVSAQFLIAGLIMWFFGLEMMKALLFPWAFLAFMWPFLFLDSVIAFPLRMMLSDFAFHFLNAIGIPSVKIGSAVVSAPDPRFHLAAAQRFAIDIADPCSGIRSLFALLMVSALFGHFSVRRPWQKLVLILAAIPFAIVGNFVRILMLVFGTIIFGTNFAIGTEEAPSTYHMAAGFFVFLVAIGSMLLLAQLFTIDWRNLWDSLRKTARSRSLTPLRREKIEPIQDMY
jgi:exosortase